MNQKIKDITIGIAVKDVKEATAWYKSLLSENVEVMESPLETIELRLTYNVWLQLDDTGYLKLGASRRLFALRHRTLKYHISLQRILLLTWKIL